MTPERWRRITEVFHAALAREGATRGPLLDEACAGDLALRAEVDAMLAAHQDAGRFGDEPAFAPDIPRLRPGAALGPYRIETLIESGGMGEVYLARDTRLDRDVAVKVLRVHVASDPALKQRLEREAKALATLSHPHICPVFDVGQQDGVDYLVMEYLDGETLEKRLTKGALPLDQALRCAIEIADALDKAHRQGIVHRDLKPSNIMLTKKGAKLLDFGLAKLRPSSPLAAGGAPPSPLTGQGKIIGTLQYMAPEQLNGEEADARTDIFALGAVVHEMVTGQKAFEGKTPASIIAAILEREPAAVSTLRPLSPPALDHLVRTCLAKAPDQRWQSAGDVGRSLTWLLGEGSHPGAALPVAARPTPMGWRRALPFALAAGVGGLIVGVAAWVLKPAPLPDPRPISRFEYELPEGVEFRNADRPVMALSADGSQFVYNTTRGLYLRSLRDSDARLIPGTQEDLSGPFFSPDGQWVGYFSGGQLKKIATGGGTPIPLCEAGAPFGAHWGSDGTIVFGQSQGIMQVSANGGAPALLVAAKAGEQVDGPQVLPGGEWVLLTVTRGSTETRWNEAQVAVQSIRTAERRVLWTGGSGAKYVSTGHLMYAVKDVLFALAFDVGDLKVSGRPVSVVTGVQRAPVPRLHSGFAGYGLSDGGTLAYVRSEEVGRNRVLALADRQGGVERFNVPPGPYVNPRLSPDRSRLVVQTLDDDERGEIWVWELSGNRQIRQLTAGGSNRYPIWTPDGKRVTFASDRDGAESIYWQATDGSAPQRPDDRQARLLAAT